jgi:mannose-6-phosphate isomerase-like protein (cupin superfamily)
MNAPLPMRPFTRDEILKRTAFYAELTSFSSGFSDAVVPNTHRLMSNVMGYQLPPDGGRSPVGADAAKHAAIKVAEGFNLAYVRCKPGFGPLMHNHDTAETFIPMTGRWRLYFNEDETDHVDVGPWDVLSFPPQVARRFENITFAEPDTDHVLMVIVSGDAPRAETTERAKAIIAGYEKAASEA